jgi:hypothetical protein
VTIEALASELTNDDGSYDGSRAVHMHTQVVATTAASVESVIRDLDLLNRGPEAVDPVEILRVLATTQTAKQITAARWPSPER